MSNLHNLDPAFAALFGARSLWARVFLFFLSCWISVLAAQFSVLVGNSVMAHFPTVYSDGSQVGKTPKEFIEILSEAVGYVIWVPLTWLGAIVFGLTGYGIWILPVLGCALLILLYSEDAYWHGIFLILFAHPIHTMIAAGEQEILSWCFLFAFLLGIVALYILCWRAQNRSA